MDNLIKICGLSTPETLDVALGAGADLVGFVRYPKSPRHVSLDLGHRLSLQAKGRAQRVVLLVNPGDEDIAQAIEAINPDLIQLHGSETPERVAEIRSMVRRPVMKAFGIAEPSDLKALTPYAGGVDRILLDAKPPRTANALPGGNGLAFDWRLLNGLDPKLSFMLSGGLDSRQRGGGDPVDPVAGRRCVDRGGKRTGSQGSGADRGLHQGRPDSIRCCPSLTSGCVPLPGRALRSSRQDRPCQLKPNPIPSAPVPTSAGISAPSAAASSPRP